MFRRLHFKSVSSFLQMHLHRGVLATAWACLFASPPAYGDSEVNRSRFLEEYQPHAAAIEQRYSNIHFDVLTTSDAGATEQISRTTGKFNHWNFLLKSKSYKQVDKKTGKALHEYESKEGAEALDCRNALYSFALIPGDGREYVLRDLNIHDAAHETEFCFLSVPYANWYEKKTYLEIAQDQNTQILAFKDCVWQGKSLKMLECQYPKIHPVTHKQIEVLTNYFFSPEDGWICCGWGPGSAQKSGESAEEIYFYESEPGENLPKLKRIEKWQRNIQNPRQSKLRSATDIIEFRRAPKPFSDADFKLAAFGLPEPMGVKQEEPAYTWRWLIAAAAGAGLIAILFAWLKRRHDTPKPAKT